MQKIKVEVSWSGNNYSCGWGYPGFGLVVSTSRTLEELKSDFESAIQAQITEMLSDNEEIPEWLAERDYEIDYELKASALLRCAEKFTTMAALSRVTGINQRLLSNYASDVKRPREAQMKKIISGIREIGRQCMALC